ncbi:MAG: glycosyltransferase [Boseongicola sp.]|nr:glycosyltransferase [Boseongicola sp.]
MISAIIPFRDWSLTRLETCVGFLRQLPSISEIVLVDFGSVEPISELPGCRVVSVRSDRWCLSEANNIGIAEAKNDVILKLDADMHILLDNDTLEGLAQTILSGEVACHVLQTTDFDTINGQRARKRLRPNWSEGISLFSRPVVVEIGGFDSRYFDYGGEDNDLCQRLRRYGKRVSAFWSEKVLHERHPPSDSRIQGRFTDSHKKTLLADASIFRTRPFRYSDYENTTVFGPAITVAISTTARPNRNAHLTHCLNGMAAQSVQDFEVLICDNGSPAASRLSQASLRKSFPTLDIQVFSLDEPSIPKARNLITDRARGFYIAVHDDDDFSVPTRFEEQLECIAANSGAHGCHSSWIEFDETNGRLTSYLGQTRRIDKLFRKPGKVTLHSSGFYRRDVLERIRYDETLTLGADYDLNIRMLLSGLDIQHTRKFHCMRRLHSSSVSSNGSTTQRVVSDRTNRAYKYFLGEPFLAAIRDEDAESPWITGFPTMHEMLAYLPSDFGAFRIDLDLESALTLGFDPIFGLEGHGKTGAFEGLDFMPAFQGYGHNTKFVMRTTQALTAGACLQKLKSFLGLRGVDVVSDIELANHTKLQSLEDITVGRGQRRVMSRRFETMAEALAALPSGLLTLGLGQIQFFAVNHPEAGVHVLLGTFDNVADLEYALRVANSGSVGDFMAVTNRGKRGGFNGT